MIATILIAAIVSLLVSSLGTLIALKIQHSYLQRMHIQHKAREQAQEGALRNWEVNQEKRTLGIETKLTTRVQQLEKSWQAWEKQDASRIEALTQQNAESFMAQQVERELARLPLVEETPLAFNRNGQHLPEFSYWQPPALARADLSERDLSHRYIGQADLREAQLRGANFFMSDLSGACLVGANLTGADLTGANLSNADLRNSVLTNANLQVADLTHTILLGANLHSARNLTTQQLYAAIYDHTTQLDADIDLTMPNLPRIRRTILKPMPDDQASVVELATPTNAEPAVIESAPVVKPATLANTEPEAIEPTPVVESAAPTNAELEAIQPAAEALTTPTEAPITPVLEGAAVPTGENIVATNAAAEMPLTDVVGIDAAESETPIAALQVHVEALETLEVSTAETETPAEAVVLPEELVIDEIEHGTNGSNGSNGKHLEQESASANTDAVLVPLELAEPVKNENTDTMLAPLELAEPVIDEPISEYAATAAAVDMPVFMPLIFPRSIETTETSQTIEQEDTTALLAFKKQSSGEEPAWSSSESQPAEDALESKPEPDFSSPQPLDGSPEDEKVASIQADVSKSRPMLPIDISTQKGKFSGNNRKRLRAR